MSDPNEIKAGSYQLVALRWDHITSKPGEPLDYTRYHRGDVMRLNAEDAKRLVAAGAVVKPGELERSAAEQARAIAEQAQRNYEAILSGLPDDVRAEVAPGTVAQTGDTGNPAPAPADQGSGSGATGGATGGPTGGATGDKPATNGIADILLWVGTDKDRAAIALAAERESRAADKVRPNLVTPLEALIDGTGS